MKIVRIAFCAALAAVLTNASAYGQEAAWAYPEGLYTLTPSRANAHLLESTEGTVANFQLGPNPIPVRMCAVRAARAIPNSESLTQSVLNERLAAIMGPQAPVTPGPLTITGRRAFERGGVMVFASRAESSEAVLHYRRFALASPRGATLHEINCGGAPPVSAADEAGFEAFLDTLQFTHRDHP